MLPFKDIVGRLRLREEIGLPKVTESIWQK